jgi:hypothetical protein
MRLLQRRDRAVAGTAHQAARRGLFEKRRIGFREIIPPPIAATAMKVLFRGAGKQRELKA